MRLVNIYIIHSVILVLLIIFAFRSGGLDYEAYYLEFIDPINNSVSNEIGYKLLIASMHNVADFWAVLLLANIFVYISHRKFINNFLTIDKAFVFFVYFSYLSLFLIWGSPRRLIAYSLFFAILYDTFRFNRISLKIYIYPVLAVLFHVSSIIVIPVIIFFRYKVKDYLKIEFFVSVFFLLMLLGYTLYLFGVVDYIFLKLEYYRLYALEEQEYLSEVPSVYAGIMKRLLVIFLYTLCISKWDRGMAIIKLCYMEASLYFFLGLFSPVLSVVATYLSAAYLFPFTCLEYQRASLLKKMMLISGVSAYYIPTIVGLIKLFGDVYVG